MSLPPPVAHTAARPRLLLFGDSITQQSFSPGGWGARLADTYQRKLDVVNRGYSGYTSEWALSIAHRVLNDAFVTPLAGVIIFFGANDAALPTAGSARQHVPLARYKANLVKLVTAARAAGARTVLVVAPGPVDAAARVKHAVAARGAPPGTPPDRDLATTAAYAEAAVQAASSVGAPCVDLCARLRSAAPDDVLSDGLHLTPAGNAAVFDAVYAALVAADPSLHPDALPLDFEPHDAYDACEANENDDDGGGGGDDGD